MAVSSRRISPLPKIILHLPRTIETPSRKTREEVIRLQPNPPKPFRLMLLSLPQSTFYQDKIYSRLWLQ